VAREFGNVSLYAEHLPEDHTTGGETTELPGFVEVGVVVDGARVPLARVKAGDVLEKIDAAKQSRSEDEPAEPSGETSEHRGF
jgi:hypothetical protein